MGIWGGEFILSKTHCFLRDLVDFLKVTFPGDVMTDLCDLVISEKTIPGG